MCSSDLALYGRKNNTWEKIIIGPPGGNNGIPEAPKDGKLYGRKSETWVEFVDQIGLEDAPKNSKQYIRKNGAWVELVIPTVPGTGILDAPNDGNLYSKKNNTWVEIAGGTEGVSEAPDDGKQYVRKNKAWVEIVNNASDVLEAPNDGSIYGRKNGSWVSINSNGIDEAPKDGHNYYRYNGGWNRLQIIDDLTSTSTTNVLSANQGRLLNEKIFAKPNSSTWVPLVSTIGIGGNSPKIPNGGTWAYFFVYLKYHSALNLYTMEGTSGVVPGGTSIPFFSGYGFAWKISD